MKKFEKFVSSPFHNSVKNNKRLITELKRFYPRFDNGKLSYEYLFGKIYPGKKFNKQMMWNLISSIEKLARDFLELIALKQDKIQADGLLLSELGKRKLLNDYLHSLNQMEKQLETHPIDYDYFESKGHFENYRQEYYHLTDNIQPMSDSKVKASEYQIMLFLRMTVGGLNDMRALSDNYNTKFDVNIPMEFARNIDFEKIVAYARNKKFEYTFLIEIYYHALMTILISGETLHFNKLRELYTIHFNKFTLSEKRTIMHWLANYCIRSFRFNENKYRRIMFELNEFRLKEGLVYYPEGQIPKTVYFQILSCALYINETEWAANFIKNYTSKLQPKIRKSTKAIAYAYLHFGTKEYDKVLENLNNVQFFEITDKLYVRELIAKTYYETCKFESLLHHIDASLHFLADNPSVPERDRIPFVNFLNTLKKIIFIKENSDRVSVRKMRNTIEQIKSTEKSQWLMEKLDELGKTLNR